MSSSRPRSEAHREKVVLVGLARSNGELDAAEESLAELAQLAETAGAQAVDQVLQVKATPDPATYIGKGKAKEIVETARRQKATAIVFDDELAPAQGRNLEDLAQVNPLAPDALKIIDRTGLILDVFAQHANSAEGKLQVELAQINYLIPRLRGWGDVMSRIGGGRAAGGGAAGPGLGTRGPGETKLEVDRRRIGRRLTKLKQELEEVERTRNIKRSRRAKAGVTQIGLVGYTNSGKSTLLNALTNAGVLVQDRLFSTLDPTARRLDLPDGPSVVLVDTVGFVRKLPHQLVEAFRSTLEETVHSDLLLHVVDGAQADPVAQVEAVNIVLNDIGARDIPRILALNKAELLSQVDRQKLLRAFPDGILISALKREGLDELLQRIKQRLSEASSVAVLHIPFSRADIRSRIHRDAEVLEEASEPSGMRLRVRATPAVLGDWSEYVQVSEPAPQSDYPAEDAKVVGGFDGGH